MTLSPAKSRASAVSAEDVRAALARPEFYPDRPDRVDVRETHISWVFLAGDRAYKLKKPLVLPFLDYGTPQRRREMCREEVRLNRRLAPDVYLGVRAVAASAGRPGAGGGGRPAGGRLSWSRCAATTSAPRWRRGSSAVS